MLSTFDALYKADGFRLNCWEDREFKTKSEKEGDVPGDPETAALAEPGVRSLLLVPIWNYPQ